MSLNVLTAPSAYIDFTAPNHLSAPIRQTFGSALHLLIAWQAAEVPAVLNQAHAHSRQGRWCVGYVSYEAAAAFDSAFSLHSSAEPLAWFAVYDQALAEPPPSPAGSWALTPWGSSIERSEFESQIARIQCAIAQGEVYQINFTSALHSRFEGDVLALFDALRRAQPNSYSAYLDTGGMRLLSASPELFFDWRDEHILSRPMKGTAARGDTPQTDMDSASTLRHSAKERAENLMIVDLIRNDLSRIAEPYSVHVPKLFETHAWPTIWQMTSDVVAKTKADIQLADVFAALFPCGSVTGAPKVRAMHWIKQLEAKVRGAYCGAIGVLQPGGAATFNVAIRTIELRGSAAICGIGSGITADATVAGEWQEWQNKQGFLQRCQTPFELLETLLLKGGRYPHFDGHLARMATAASHFGYHFDAIEVNAVLSALAKNHNEGAWRVRLRSDAVGRVKGEAHALHDSHCPVRVQLASKPIREAHSEFVRFKTTRRGHYAVFEATDPDVFDTLLWNEANEVTEFTRGNVAVLIDGQWRTPALRSGLLAGIGRANALREGRVTETIILRSDLARAQGLAFVNALRGWLDVELV